MLLSPRLCAWCRRSMPVTARVDAITCSKSCRQARHRFGRAVQLSTAAATPKRLAYADPPYPGKSHLYRGHPDYGGEVDHRALVSRLQEYDGWALSTSEDALPMVVSLLARIDGWSIASWFKGARPGRSTRARSSWEPVIYRPAREVVSCSPGIDSYFRAARGRPTAPAYVIGAKPPGFCNWVFRDLLQAAHGDSFDDLFPGSGGVARAWTLYTSLKDFSDVSSPSPDDTSREYSGDTSSPSPLDTSPEY